MSRIQQQIIDITDPLQPYNFIFLRLGGGRLSKIYLKLAFSCASDSTLYIPIALFLLSETFQPDLSLLSIAFIVNIYRSESWWLENFLWYWH